VYKYPMKIPALVAGILIAATSQLAQAVTVRVDFSGSVYSVEGSGYMEDPIGAIGGSIEPGTPFTAYLVFDDAVPPFREGPGYADYAFTPSEAEFHSEVGDFVFDATYIEPDEPERIFSLTLIDREVMWSHVYWQARVGDRPTGPDLAPDLFGVELAGDSSGEPLASSALSDVPWILELFPVAELYWNLSNGNIETVYVRGTIENLSATVPEPGPGALVAAMLAGLVALGFRRARV
jgi:hypothetical protein